MAKEKKKLSRRKFIFRAVAGGTGIILGATYLGRNMLRREIYGMMDQPALMAYNGDTDTPLIWFEVNADNLIKLHSPKVEMGQGTFTSLAQMAADELEVPMETVKVVHAESKTGNIDGMSTGGSTSVAGLWQPLRELAATMRTMLINKAAEKLDADPSNLKMNKGGVSGGGKSISFAEIVEGVEQWEIPDTPELKKISDYKYVGKPIPRVDLLDKVMGEPIFGMDAQMPDMLYGAIVRPSKIGARYKGADTSKAKNMPGVVKIVEEEDFVGVVAKTMMQAENAKNAIKANWEVDKEWQLEEIVEMIKVGNGDDMLVQKQGGSGIFDEAQEDGTLIQSEYRSPTGAHAQIEPNGAVAFVEGDKATLIISTQIVKITRASVAKRLGLKEENINVIPTFLGGGFGRRLNSSPHAEQIAVLSKAVGKPVKCFYSRKEEFQNDTFRPPTHHIMQAKMGSDGSIQALKHEFASGDVAIDSELLPGFAHDILGTDVGAIRGGLIQYKGIPVHRAVSWHVELPFATSWWRSLGLLANTFAIESFIDELAIATNQDPIQLRLNHIQDDESGTRLRKVIERARDLSDYRNEVSGNRAMGFAASTDAGTPCAQVAEVSVTDNEIKVEKVTCVMDPGLSVNPDQVRAQCEGSIIMGISASMFEKMEIKNSELSPTIYGAYKMALMKNAPREINVELLNGTGIPGPVGEPPLGPIGAAIANAVFRVTGQRLRELPLSLA